MTTAYNLGRLTVKMAADYDPKPPAPRTLRAMAAPYTSAIAESIVGKAPPQSNTYLIAPNWYQRQQPSTMRSAPTLVTYVGSEDTAKKFVPSPEWPAVATKHDDIMSDTYYGTVRNPLGERGLVYTPASQLYHKNLPIANLASNKTKPTTVFQLATQAITRPAGIIGGLAQTRARNVYENRLHDLRNIAFDERTTIPFYYTEAREPLENSHVVSNNVDPANSKSQAAGMILGRLNYNSRLGSTGVTPDAVALHEHAHTTQAKSPSKLPNSAFEIPAVLSEMGHVADAYHAATGQWPKGEYLGMPIQEIAEDLKRRRHIGGPVTINEIMQSPEYLNRITRAGNTIAKQEAEQRYVDRMVEWSHPKYNLDENKSPPRPPLPPLPPNFKLPPRYFR